MFKSITKRDVKFFLLGILLVLIIDLIFNWPDAKQGFLDGYNGK
jgi:hypothetical protein